MGFDSIRKRINRIRGGSISMRTKMIVSLSAIAIVLLVSCVISVMEYHRMSTYVSDLMADNIKSITLAQRLCDAANSYNLDVLAVIGDEANTKVPSFDQREFMSHYDSLRTSLASIRMLPLADSVVYAYSAYMLTSLELKDVLLSPFIDSRTWFFERLQPRYNRLNDSLDKLSDEIYEELKKNSMTFERGFYRSIIPGIVAVGVGLLLVLMLLFFLLVDYVNPLYKMLAGLNDYRSYNKKYNYKFDGDDQLTELNDGITELVGENIQLRKRVQALRNTMNQNN